VASAEYAARIFWGSTLEKPDNRREYGEVRIQAMGRVIDDILFFSSHRSRRCPSYHFRAARQQEGV
jgi:hypothetical protein